MSTREFLMRVLLGLSPMLPALVTSAVMTLLAAAVLTRVCRHTWMGDKGFSISGLFFGLTGRGCLRLACAWLKLIFLVTFIAAFKKLTILGYGMFLLTGVMEALFAQTFIRKLSGMFWLVLQIAGLLSVNLICGYILDMYGGWIFYLIYGAMGLFLTLFGIYLFLLEVSDISDGRHVDAERIWGEQSKQSSREV